MVKNKSQGRSDNQTKMEPDRDWSFDKSTNFAGLIYFYTFLFICVHGSVDWSN